MKVLAFNRRPGAEISDSSSVSLLTDSSIVYPGRPLFLPPFSQEWEMRIVPVVEINRQGKYIAEKFADRYVGRVALGARLLPAGVSPDGSAMLTAFDGALSIGPWLRPLEKGKALTIALAPDAAEEIAYDALAIEEAVAAVSRRFTFRTGDILVPAITSLAPPVAIDTRVVCRLNGLEALRLKIK